MPGDPFNDPDAQDPTRAPVPGGAGEEMPSAGQAPDEQVMDDDKPVAGTKEVPASEAIKKRRPTMSFKKIGEAATGFKHKAVRNPKRTLIIVGVLVVTVLITLMVIGIVVETTKSTPQVAKTSLAGSLKTADDTSRRLDNFMERMDQRWSKAEEARDDLKTLLERQDKKLTELNERIQAVDAKQTKAVADMAERLNKNRRGGADFIFVNPDAPAAAAGGKGFEAAYQAAVKLMSDERRAGKLSLREARLRCQRLAEEHGYKGADALSMRDEMLDRIGFLHVGQVEEPAASEAEISTLHPLLRPLLPKVRDFQANLATFEGKCMPRPDEVTKLVRAELGPEKSREVDAGDIARLATVARVRMLNCTDQQEEKLADLFAERDQKRIKREDLLALERLVWAHKTDLGGLLPGQHVALVWVLGRGDRKGGSEDIKVELEKVTPADLDLFGMIAERAITAALDGGMKAQQDLMQRAGTAVDNAAEAQRKTIPADQRTRLVTNALARVLGQRQRQEASAPTPPAVVSTPLTAPSSAQHGIAAASEGIARDAIHLGQLSLRKNHAGRAAWGMVTLVVKRLGVDPASVKGATVTAGLWEIAPGIGTAAFDEAIAQPVSGRVWTDLVLQRLTGAAAAIEKLADAKLAVPGVPADLQEYVSGIYLAVQLGAYHDDHERSQSAFRLAVERLGKNPPILNDQQVKAIYAVPAGRHWERVAVVAQSISAQKAFASPARLQDLESASSAWLADRVAAVAQIAQHHRVAERSRSTLAKEVTDGLYTVMPLVLGQLDEQLSLDICKQVFREQATIFATLSVAESQLMGMAAERLLITYLNLMDPNTGGAARLVGRMQEWVPERVVGLFKQTQPQLTDSSFIDVGVSLAEGSFAEAERQILREMLHARIEPRLERAGRDLDPKGVQEAIAVVHRASEQLVGQPPFPVNEIDRLAIRLQQIGMAYLKDRRDPTRPEPTAKEGDDKKTKPKSGFPTVTAIKSSSLPGTPIGAFTTAGAADQPRVIPGLSFAEAHLVTGLAPEINGGNTNLYVVLECQPMWNGPGGSTVQMPRLRVGGVGKPQAGPSRISVELTKLTYVFPNGRQIEKPIQGFVTDTVVGMSGMLAEWHTNWQKVLPPAVTAGILEGGAAALDTGNQAVQVNGGGTTTVTTNTGSTLERAAVGGLSEGATIVGDYFRQFMAEVKPTVEAPNGQPMTVWIFSTVAFPEVSESEWNEIDAPTTNSGF